MEVLQMIFYSVGILFMITFMFIGIWSFIIYNKVYKTKRIHNYILEKIYQHITSNDVTFNNSLKESSFDINTLLEEDDLFNDDKTQQ